MNPSEFPNSSGGRVDQLPDLIRPVPGFPGYYADWFGGIWSARFRGVLREMKTRKLSGYPYMSLHLMKQGKKKLMRVHKVVILAYKGESPVEGLFCCHADGNSFNNKPSNLYWGTRERNTQDTVDHGVQKGERNPNSVLTEDVVREIRAMHANGISSEWLAQKYKTTRQTISAAVFKRRWGHVK